MAGTGEDRLARKVTLADVARYAGVSTAVVSYVINNGPRPVAATTAQRVRDAVDTLGYRPNSQARALRTGRTGVLGLVLPGTSNPFFGEFHDVINDAAAGAGYALLTANSAAVAAREPELIDHLARRGVDAILDVTVTSEVEVSRLRHPGVPVVLANCSYPVPGFHTVGPDSMAGARQAVDHLLRVHDRQSVALVTGEPGIPRPQERELGWRDAHQRLGRREGPLVRTSFTADGGYDGTRRLLIDQAALTAIFVTSDLQAYGSLYALHEQGVRVPEDVAVVTYDGSRQSVYSWPSLTVVRQPISAMADAAVTAAVAGGPASHSLFDLELVTGRSCGCG